MTDHPDGMRWRTPRACRLGDDLGTVLLPYAPARWPPSSTSLSTHSRRTSEPSTESSTCLTDRVPSIGPRRCSSSDPPTGSTSDLLQLGGIAGVDRRVDVIDGDGDEGGSESLRLQLPSESTRESPGSARPKLPRLRGSSRLGIAGSPAHGERVQQHDRAY